MLKKQTRAAAAGSSRAFCRNCEDDIRHSPDTQHHISSDSEKRVVIVVLIEPAACSIALQHYSTATALSDASISVILTM